MRRIVGAADGMRRDLLRFVRNRGYGFGTREQEKTLATPSRQSQNRKDLRPKAGVDLRGRG